VRVGGDEVSCRVLRCYGVDWNIAAVPILVEDVGMSVREGASLDILSGDSNVITLIDQGSECKSLSSAPINTFAAVDSSVTSLEDLLNLGVELTIGWQDCDLVSNITNHLKIDTRIFEVTILLRVLDGLPLLTLPIFGVEFQVLTLLVGLFERRHRHIVNLGKRSLWDAQIDKLASVYISHRLHILDDGVHEGLGECWLIKFIVTHLTITNKINDNITAEFLTILGGNREGICHIVHRVSIHMEDGSADSGGDL